MNFNLYFSLNSNLASGYYSGDMDILTNIGRYWCTNNANLPSGQSWGVCDVIVPVHSGEMAQILYNTNGIFTRIYANSQWYSWVQTQNKLPGTIFFENYGLAVNANDGGYSIINNNRRWRLHANSTSFWLHEFDLDNNVLNTYTFKDGNFTLSGGDLIDGNSNKLSDKQNKDSANAQTVILSNTQVTTTDKTLTFAESIYNYNAIVLKFTMANNYTYHYTIPYCCYDTLWHPIHIAYNSTQFFENVDFKLNSGTAARIHVTSQGTDTSWNNSLYVKICGIGER